MLSFSNARKQEPVRIFEFTLNVNIVKRIVDTFIKAYSHSTERAPEQVQETEMGLMVPTILYRNVHTVLRQGKELGSIVSYCAGPVPSLGPGPGPFPVQCE